MRKILQGSLILRALAAAAAWLDRQWSGCLLRRLIVGPDTPRAASGGLLSGIAARMRSLLCGIFDALRLDRLLEGSVFRRAYFWTALAVLAAPVLPTMAVLGLTVIATGSMILCFGCDRGLKSVRSPLRKWVIGFAAMEMASTLFSVTLTGSLMGGLLTSFFTLFALVVMDVCRTREQIDRLINVIIFSGLAVGAIGVMQAVLGMESTEAWVDTDSFSDLTLRVYSTLGNPNVLAEYLLLVIPISAATVYTAKTPNGKLMALVCTGVMGLCLLLTYARGGYLGLLFAAALFLVIMDRRFIVLGVFGLMLLPFVLPQSIIARFASIGDLSDSSTSYRVYIWMASLNMLRDYWLSGFGTGTEAFRRVYPKYSFNAVSAPHSHNLFLQVFCENGIGGIFLLMGTLCSCVRTLSQVISAGDKRLRVQSAAVLAGIAGFCVESMTDYSFYNYRVTLMFWVIVGLAAAMGAVCREEASR